MRPIRVLFVVVASLLVLLGSACARPAGPEAMAGTAPTPEATARSAASPEPTAGSEISPEAAPDTEASSEEATGAEVAAEEPAGDGIPEEVFEDLEELDPNNFDNPTTIDNEWFPLKPGMQWVYEGVTEEGGQRIPHRVIFTVTDLTKVIDGVPVLVAWDQDYSAGELEETELAFFAQDNDGNVWHLGQYPEAYEGGKLVEAPAWISGLKGARAGISMKADPQVGAPSYSQGWGPAVSWTDRAQAAAMGVETCVPVDCYEDVLVIEEFSREEPDAFQLKYYARGVGNIRVGWKGADATRETLELVEFVQLSPEAMAEVREQALALEKRAYEISKEVYDQTPPAEQLPSANGP